MPVHRIVLAALAAVVVALVALDAAGDRAPAPAEIADRVLAGVGLTDARAYGARPADPLFTDVAPSAGLTMFHDNGNRGRFEITEIIGPGVGVLDYDGDGDLDVFLTGGGPVYRPEAAQPSRLYRNDGGRYTDVTAAANAAVRGHAYGVACADYDDDGDVDVFVTRAGPDVLLRNRGDGTFEDVSDAAGIAGDGNSTSAAFVDYDVDGDLDLYVTVYVVTSEDDERFCYSGLGIREYCGPTAYPPSPDHLYRNDGDGTFTDVSVEAGITGALGNGLGVVACDFDDDGWPDIYVANDQVPAFFWHNDGDGTFTEEASLRGCAYDRHGVAIAGMGIACEDFDHDLDFDLLVTNIRSETHLLLTNHGGRFIDEGGRMGIGTWSMDMTAFGIVVFDQDDDGAFDAYIANGDVTLGGPAASPDNPYSQPDQFVRFRDGRFVDATVEAGIAYGDVGRAVAAADCDGDGDLDLIVTNNAGPVRLFRNEHDGRSGAWIGVDCRTGPGHRIAIGARVLVRAGGRTWLREVRPQQSYLASGDPRVHVGLGDVDVVDEVVVEWIGGGRTVRRDVPVNAVLRIDREPDA